MNMGDSLTSQLLKEMVFSGKRVRKCVEASVIGAILIPAIRLNGYEIYLYGVRDNIYAFKSYFNSNGMELAGVIDNEIPEEFKVKEVSYISRKEFLHIANKEKVFILIPHYFSNEFDDITNWLIKNGFNHYYTMVWQDVIEINTSVFPSSTFYYRKNITKLQSVFELLYDVSSKKVFFEYVRAQIQFDRFSQISCYSGYKYLWGGYERDNKEDLYIHLEDEVWINCGSSIGENIFLYFDNSLSCKQIYGFEGDISTYNKLCNNISMLPEQYSSKIKLVNTYITEDMEYEKYIEYPVTFINADIEGAEMNMLKCLSEIIVQDRPVLAICVYHKKEDLIDIPLYINSLVDDYKFLLRKYEATDGDHTGCNEAVFYAIPNERLAYVNFGCDSKIDG